MKRCKGIKKKFGELVGKPLVQQKKQNNFPYAVKKIKKNICKVVWTVVKALKQIWKMCWGTASATEKTKQFPFSVQKIKKYMQSCMKSFKGLNTSLRNVLGNRLCNRKTKQVPLCYEENSKITAKLCEKL